MHALEGEIFEFGDFILAPDERLLLCRGEPVALTPKAFDVLLALVRRSGHLVTKDDLLRLVWPDTFVDEVNLTVNISALRKAIERDRNGTEVIQTVPKRGYRFVAPVRTRTIAAASPGRDIREGSRISTDHPDAYRAYLEGRHHWNLRSQQGLKEAIERFQRAIALDRRFAAAHAGLADCYATLGQLSWLAPSEAFPTARLHAIKALEVDASLAEPHASLGFVKLYFDWDWSNAEAEFQHAIALDAGHAATHQWYSIFLLAAGRPADAFREIDAARRADALSVPINCDLGFHYYYTGQYDEALKQLRFVLELDDQFPPAHLWLGRTYQELGRFDDALAEFARVEQRVGEWPVSMAARGFVAGIAGRTEEARSVLAALETLAGRTFVTSYGVGLVRAGLGEIDAAFAWLDRAFGERSNWLVWLRLDPRWKRLHPDPRFGELVRRLRYPG